MVGRDLRLPLSLIEPTPQWALEQQREPRSIRGEPRWTETHTCKHTLPQSLTCHMLSHLHRHQAACNPRALSVCSCLCVYGGIHYMHAVWTTHEQSHNGWKMHLHREQRCSGGDNCSFNLHMSCKTHTCSDFTKYGTFHVKCRMQERRNCSDWQTKLNGVYLYSAFLPSLKAQSSIQSHSHIHSLMEAQMPNTGTNLPPEVLWGSVSGPKRLQGIEPAIFLSEVDPYCTAPQLLITFQLVQWA